MRFICFILLVLIIGALALFAFQNQDDVTVYYLNESVTFPLALGMGIVYLLGMISGWSFVGLLRRSFRRVTDDRER